MTDLKQLLELLFPKDTFKWFDLAGSSHEGEDIHITFEERNTPPPGIPEGKKVVSKGFKDITITDFPIRGKRSLLTFRRRSWQIEGEPGIITNDIKLAFPGTKLEQEFAVFLKEDGGRQSGLAGFYRKVSSPPGEGV